MILFIVGDLLVILAGIIGAIIWYKKINPATTWIYSIYIFIIILLFTIYSIFCIFNI
jgi:hypothetical protein